MGWGRTLLLGDWGTQMNLDDLEREVSSLHAYFQNNQQSAASQAQAMQQLSDENHKLKLCIGALTRVLLAKNIVTHEELGSVGDMIDAM